jgi:peptide/nickel transport system substrate-binding protein
METIDHSQAQAYLHMRKLDLNEDELKALHAHLADCAECRQYAASLEDLQGKLRVAFHRQWDIAQPIKSHPGNMLMQWGREMGRSRLFTVVATVIGVIAIIGLVIGLDFILRNTRPQPAALPGAATSSPTVGPFISEPATSIPLLPSPTPIPEGTIVLKWGYTILPSTADSKAWGARWAQVLSAASGLNVVVLPGPSTEMEILEAMRDGNIHIAELDALTFIYGQSQDWVVPGPVPEYENQPDGRLMFVSRKDTGLVAGESPQMYQQLAGRHPCWPDIASMNWLPVFEYIAPAGLLKQQGVELGSPVFVTNPKLEGYVQAKAVFLKECDFAVFEAEPEEGFMSLWFPELGSMGYTFNDWTNSMQVLFYTPPLVPFHVLAFSTKLDPTQREILSNAALNLPLVSAGDHWVRFDESQATFYQQFQALVSAAPVDIPVMLSQLYWLEEYANAPQTPSPEIAPTPAPTSTGSERTLTICMGAEPAGLNFYTDSMYAQSVVLEAIYDGPIDNNGFSYQPVILEKLPSLADGDASVQPIQVKENDYVVNDAGEIVLLRPGTVVRPYGCNLSSCAVTWQGEPLEMAQLSATFTLKPGIRWSDGEPLTADDSVFGYEVASSCRDQFDPNVVCGTLGASGRFAMAATASYSALDEYSTQWVGLPGYLDQAYMTNFAHPLPRHLMKTKTPAQFQAMMETDPLGWGPYKLDRWKFGEYIQMSKNPYYFRANEGLPHFDQLTFRFFSQDEAAIIAALQDGTCDLVDMELGIKGLSVGGLLEAARQGLVQALFITTTNWEHLDFNIRPVQSILNSGAFAGWDLDGDGQGPFGDVRLRQAIAMCSDRQALVDSIFLGQSAVPDTYLPSNSPMFNNQATQWPYDPATAASLLDEAGWLDTDHDPSTPRIASGVTGVPDGTLLSMNLDTTNAALRQQVYDILSKNLAGCGIQVNFQPSQAVDFFKATADGKLYGRLYDLAEFSWMYATYPPCDLFISSQIPSEANNWSGSNNPGFVDPAYEAACGQQMQSLPGEPAYDQAALEAQRIFAEQLPVIPLFLREIHAAARIDMCGYSLDPTSTSDMSNIEAFDYGEGCK